MKRSVAIALAGAVLLAVPAGLTLAQGGPPEGKGPGMMQGQGPGGDGQRGWRRQPPSPEMIQRMLDGKLAGAKAALKLTADQEKHWPGIEKVIRDNAAERLAFREKMRAERGPGGQRGQQRDMLEGLDTMSERMTTRAAQVKKLADALRPLYATLSAEQKDVLRYTMRDAFGGGKGHGGGRHGRG